MMPQRPALPPLTPLDFRASTLTTFGECLPGHLGPHLPGFWGGSWGEQGPHSSWSLRDLVPSDPVSWVCLMCKKSPKITQQPGLPTIPRGPHPQEGRLECHASGVVEA